MHVALLMVLFLQAAAVVVCATFAAFVFAGGARRTPNVFLGLFLGFVALGQVAEVRVGLSPDLARAAFWESVVRSTGTLGAVMLYYFASVYPERNALNRAGRVLTVAGAGAFFALLPVALPSALPYAGFLPRENPWFPLWFAGNVFPGTVYLVVFGYHLRRLLQAPGNTVNRLLYVALAFAALPELHRVLAGVQVAALILADRLDAGVGVEVVFVFAPLAAAMAAVAVFAFRLPATRPPIRLLVAAPAITGLALGFIAHATVLHHRYGSASVASAAALIDGLHVLEPSLRWLLFGVFVSMAVLRHEMLEMSMGGRRRAARALVALASLGGAVALLVVGRALLGAERLDARPLDLAILAVALIASQRFQPLVDRVAARVYGVPMPGDRAQALEAYRVAVVQAVAEGREPAGDPALARLQGELGLDPREGAVVERMASATAEGPLAAGRLVAGRYRVKRFLGRGGAGRAFLARDDLLEREVVLKEVSGEGASAAGDEVAALREARVAGGLQHPNVVVVHDVVERSGGPLLVTEYLSGGTLADRLREKGRFETGEGLRFLDQLLAGLAAVHEQGVIHRDLKLENIFLLLDGTPKIGDFGIARVQGHTTVSGESLPALAGTPGYMAPEQRRGEQVTPASDVYAVGILARRCLPEGIPRPVARVIERALQEEPAERWASAGEMREALGKVAKKEPWPR